MTRASARRWSEAINVDQMAKVTGTFVPVTTPFPSGSPYNYGMSWPAYNQANAQQLFNAYAAAHGGPVTFTLQAFQDPATGKGGGLHPGGAGPVQEREGQSHHRRRVYRHHQRLHR